MKDKLTLSLLIITAVVALTDIAYMIFVICEFALLSAGKVFIYSGFNALAVIAIVINSVALLYGAIYFLLRRRGTLIK